MLDRSWYGRVLVERVEGFASKTEWRRAYDEIVSFERSLSNEGMVMIKFWMHVSEKAQRDRFEARRTDPLKSWKLTDEDWRNIGKRPEYEKAVADMLKRTDHKHAPWIVIAAESKPYARVAVVEAVIDALERGLEGVGQEPVELEAML